MNMDRLPTVGKCSMDGALTVMSQRTAQLKMENELVQGAPSPEDAPR